MRETRATLTWRHIPGLDLNNLSEPKQCRSNYQCGGVSHRRRRNFASVPVAERSEEVKDFTMPPLSAQLLKHPLAVLALVPKDASLFAAGAITGAAAKTVIAPLDCVKLLMQALKLIGKEEGIKGYWKGNLPQVIRVIPYSAVQLFACEVYKETMKTISYKKHSIILFIAGACAGMTSTFFTYPLDVLRLRLAVEPRCKTMTEVAVNMLREEGFASFYNGLGPSLIGIAPYIAANFCVFDLVKKSPPEKNKKRTKTTLVPGLVSATVATLMCYPLDTVRRQMQMRGSPYMTVLDAFTGIVARDSIGELYRGFIPNALKTLPNSSIRFMIFNSVKHLIAAGEKEYQEIIEQDRKKREQSASDSSI